jgi:hypothetical protein
MHTGDPYSGYYKKRVSDLRQDQQQPGIIIGDIS